MKLKRITAVLVCISALMSAVGASAMEIAAWTYRYGIYADKVTDAQEELWIRDIMEWKDFEKDESGIVIPASFRNRYKKLKKEGKNIIMVLAYGNSLYSGSTNTVMPTLDNEEYFEAWLNYVRTMVTEFKDEVSHFEIWNEPNLEYTNSNASAADYAKMAVETKKAIEAVHPLGEDAVVIGGAFAYARSHSQFVRDFCNNGGSEMDGLSFHIYDYGYNPEGKWAPTLLAAFGNVIDGLNYNKPIWFTETGYFTGTGSSAVSEKQQASYMIRMQALWDNFLKTRGREGKIFWFFTNDWGNDRTAVDANHGLLNVNGTAKESYFTFKALNSLIKGRDFVSLTSSGNTYKALYKDANSEDELYILWNSDDAQSAQTIEYNCDEVRVYDYKGELLQNISSGSGSIEVKADGAPKFVECLNYGTSIEKLDYTESKRILKVYGKCNYKDSVEIEIVKDQTVICKVEAPVAQGRFEKEIYTDASGMCSIYAGRGEGDEYYYGSAEFDFGKDARLAVENVTLSVNNGNVSISGTVKGAENGSKVTIMALPEMTLTDSVTAYNLAYIGETSVSGSAFSHSFAMPEKSEGRYKIYLSGSDVSDVFTGSFENGISSQLVGVCDFSASKQNEIIVYATLNNTDSAAKNASIITAQYDGEGLKAVNIEKVSVEAGTVLGKPYTVRTDSVAGATVVRAFIFDSIGGMRPLAPCVYAE